MEFSLQKLLEKYKHLKDPKEERVKIAAILSRTLNFEVTEAQVSVSRGVLTLGADNYLKTEIYMQKESILKALKDSGFEIHEVR